MFQGELRGWSAAIQVGRTLRSLRTVHRVRPQAGPSKTLSRIQSGNSWSQLVAPVTNEEASEAVHSLASQILLQKAVGGVISMEAFIAEVCIRLLRGEAAPPGLAGWGGSLSS